MKFLRLVLALLSMESWPWPRDFFEMFGLLLAMPLCLIAIPFPFTGGILLCIEAVLSPVIAYTIGQSLGDMPPFGVWIIICNVPVFLLGLLVIRLRCAELGIEFWDAFRRRQPATQNENGHLAPDVLSKALNWFFSPRTRTLLGIIWALASVAGILAIRFIDSCMVLVVALSFPSSLLPLVLFNMNKIGENGALFGCLVAGAGQWFIFVPVLAGIVRRHSSRLNEDNQLRPPRRSRAIAVIASACVAAALFIGIGMDRWGDEIKEPLREVVADPPMIIAADRGQLKVVEELIRQGKDVNSRGQRGRTALMSAAARGNMELMRILIKNGADVNIKQQRDMTALELATYAGHMSAVKLLIKHGATPGNALLSAVMRGHLDLARLMLDHGADVNARDFRGQTVLMHAAFGAGYKEGKHAEMLTLLIGRGADVHAQDRNGQTALQKLRGFTHPDPKIIAILEAAEASQPKQ